MLPIVLTDKAIADIQLAYDHLESKEHRLGEKLLSQIEEYFSIIELNPLLFREDYKKIRQVQVKPFRYLLRYKILKHQIVVIQLFHGNQNPKKKVA